MSSTKVLEAKKLVVNEISDRFKRAKSAVLTDFRGLNVAEATRLRKQLRDAGVEYRVLKNTLTQLALDDVDGLGELKNEMTGPTAVAFSYDDPVIPAKILTRFAKESKKLVIKAGIVEGMVIDAAGVAALADLPPREVLLAQVLAGFQTPISGFVTVLQGNLRNFVNVIEAVRKQREEA